MQRGLAQGIGLHCIVSFVVFHFQREEPSLGH